MTRKKITPQTVSVSQYEVDSLSSLTTTAYRKWKFQTKGLMVWYGVLEFNVPLDTV